MILACVLLVLASFGAAVGGHWEYADPDIQKLKGASIAQRSRGDAAMVGMAEQGILIWVVDKDDGKGSLEPPPIATPLPIDEPDTPGMQAQTGGAGASSQGRAPPASSGKTGGGSQGLPLSGVPKIPALSKAQEASAPGAAAAAAAEAAPLDPPSAARFNEAMSRMQTRDFAGAELALRELLERRPGDPVLLTSRADALNRLGRHEEAEADADAALKAAPDSARALEQKAYAAVRLLRLPEALAAAGRAVRFDPGNAEAHFVRYLAAGKAGDFQGALAALREAARLRPEVYGKLLKRVEKLGRFVDPRDHSALAGEADIPDEPAAPRRWRLLPLLLLPLPLLLLRRRRRATESGLRKLAPSATAGRRVGKYELKALIGRGGMGDVFEAVDTTLGRTVAIKQVSDRLAGMEVNARELLLAEARTVAALSHPAIVGIFDVLEDGSDLYLVFEHVRGRTLSHVLAESGLLPMDRAAGYLRPVCEALAFAHGRGLVHRDLKPANIMATEDGGVKLMDFGVARALGTSLTPPKPGDKAALQPFARTTTVAGTPHYMAPETESGIVSPAGDVYALGVCLYELLTGRLPFSYPEQKRSLDIQPATQLVPGLPADVDLLIRAALEPDAAKRLQSARQFQERLETIVSRRSSAS